MLEREAAKRSRKEKPQRKAAKRSSITCAVTECDVTHVCHLLTECDMAYSTEVCVSSTKHETCIQRASLAFTCRCAPVMVTCPNRPNRAFLVSLLCATTSLVLDNGLQRYDTTART